MTNHLLFTGATGQAMSGVLFAAMRQTHTADPSSFHELTLITRKPLAPESLNIDPALGIGSWRINNPTADLTALPDVDRTIQQLADATAINNICLGAGISVNPAASAAEALTNDRNRRTINQAHINLLTGLNARNVTARDARICAIGSSLAHPETLPFLEQLENPADYISYARSKLALGEMIATLSTRRDCPKNSTFAVVRPGLIGFPGYPEDFPARAETSGLNDILRHGQALCVYTARFNAQDPEYQLVTPDSIATAVLGKTLPHQRDIPRMEVIDIYDLNMGLVQQGPDGRPQWTGPMEENIAQLTL